MTDRLAAAQAALSAGRRDEAIGHLSAAVDEDPARNVQVYRTLAVQFYSAGRYAEGEAAATKGLTRYPRDHDLLNVRGVLLRKLRRQPEAAKVLEAAIKLNPKSFAAQQNLVKHGVSFEEGSSVFFDPTAITADDLAHSQQEDREKTVGMSLRLRILVVVHTQRVGEVIRIISARKATKLEANEHAEEVEIRFRQG